MAAWVVPDVLSLMPPDLKEAFLLLDEGLRDSELSTLLSSAVSDFRMAFSASSDPDGSLSEATVPDACVPRVRAIVWYYLALGLGLTDVSTLLRVPWQDAEIYLRQMLRELNREGSVLGAVGTPHYTAGPRDSFRPLSGPSVAARPSPPVVAEQINYTNASSSSTMV